MSNQFQTLKRMRYVGMAVFTVTVLMLAIIKCDDPQTEAEKQQQEAERQRIAQMEENLHRAYDGDLLEFRDGSIAVVTNKNDFGLVTKYSVGASGRQSYETLSENVVAIYTKDDTARCQAAEKFIASF